MPTRSKTSRSSSGRPSITSSMRPPSGLSQAEAVLDGGAATSVFVNSAAVGRSSRRRARSLSYQRMCWLASAKNRRTVGGRVVRRAVSSPATMPQSSSSVSRFTGGRVSRG